MPHREFLPPNVEIRGLPARWQPRPAWAPDPLVHLKCRGDSPVSPFAQGRTMRLGPSTSALRYISQKVIKKGGRTTVVSVLKHPSGLRCEHLL